MFRIDTIYTLEIVARRLLFWSPSTGTFFLWSFTHNNLELDDIKCLWIEVLFPKFLDLFVVHQIYQNIFQKMLIANWNQCLRTSLWRTKNAF